MNIPSNYTPEEILKCCTDGVPGWFVAEYEKLISQKDSALTDEIEAAVERETEAIYEQLYFARELLAGIINECSHTMVGCRKDSGVYKLAASIKAKVDDSYFEM